jgi:hypothetical protein
VKRVERGELVESECDLAAEAAAIQALRGLGFEQVPDLGDREGLWFELTDGDGWLRFMERDAPRLAAEGWRIEAADDFRFKVARLGDWHMDVAEGEGGRWLDIGLRVEVDGEPVDLLPFLVELLQTVGIVARAAVLTAMPVGAAMLL